MRRGAQPAEADCGGDLLIEQPLPRFVDRLALGQRGRAVEADDSAALRRAARREDIAADRGQALAEQVGDVAELRPDRLESHLQQQGDRAAQPQQRGGGLRAGLEAARVGLEQDRLTAVFEAVHHAARAEQRRDHLLDQVLAHVEQPGAGWAEHPLVAAGGEEVHVVAHHIDRHRACGLDRVDRQQPALRVDGVGQRAQRAAEAGAPLHVRDRQQPGARADRGDYVFGGDASVGLRGDDVDFDALRAQRGPGVAVGGVFGVGHHDVIAGLPGQAAGDDRKPGGGVGRHRDFVPAARAEQRCGLFPQRVGLLHPVGAGPAAPRRVIDVAAHRVGGRPGQRRDAGVVEECHLIEHGEQIGAVGHHVSLSCCR